MTSAAHVLADPSSIDATEERIDDPVYQAYVVLWVGFTIAPIAFGLDKFFGVLTHWEQYLAPWVGAFVPGSPSTIMHAVGIVEIVAGIAVALRPRYGAYLVAAWLALIIVNLLTYSGYYDIALRDFGLSLAACSLGMLAKEYGRPIWKAYRAA